MKKNIDASAITLLINVSNQSPNDHIPKEYFSTLSPEARKIWSNIPNDMKVVMLRIRTVNSNEVVDSHSKPTSYPPRKFTTAHLHEILTELISESSSSEKNEADDTKDEPDSESKFFVNSTSANAIRPGDIHKLMSIPDKV